MTMHWTERQEAVKNTGEALQALGWRLWGFHEDKSDSMTDYYCPASWDGVATLEHEGEQLLVGVDVSSYCVKAHSGDTMIHQEQNLVGDCVRCEGSGHDPEIPFTLREARINPHEYHKAYRAVHCPGAVALLKDVVSPLQFTSDGGAKCRDCHGSGKTWETVEREGDTWPEFHATPKGSTWHVERGGQIIAKGTGLNKASRYHGKAEELAARIHQVATGAVEISAGRGVTMRRNERLGGVELKFPAKPPEDVLLRVKAAGFRFSRRQNLWYRKATPEAVAFAEKLVSGTA